MLLAGCSGGQTDTTAPTVIDSETPARSSTATPTAEPTPTATPTPRPPQNPWKADVVKIAINDTTDTDRNWTAMVQEGAQYWNNSAGDYTNFEVNFTIIDDPRRADVVVYILPKIEVCGLEVSLDTFLGCADSHDEVGEALYTGGPSMVKIADGYQRPVTVETISHEFGHMLGLGHQDGDTVPVMRTNVSAAEVLQPNATERAWPWGDERSIEVFVDENSVPEYLRPEYRRQVTDVVEYYDSGADGFMPANTSVSITDEQSNADINVTFPETRPGDEPASSPRVFGLDPDQDAALETYTSFNIAVEQGIDSDNSGWHVGYWMAYAFGAESVEDKPDPFDTDNDDRDNWK